MPDNTLDLSAFEGHTPGPWVADKGDLRSDDAERPCVLVRRWEQQTGQRLYSLATIENGAPGDTLETEKVNARLIAASPVLLAEVLRLRALLASPRSPSGQPSEKAVIPRSALFGVGDDSWEWDVANECLISSQDASIRDIPVHIVRADAVSVQEGA